MGSEAESSGEPASTKVSGEAPHTWLNALLGAAVTIFLSFIPFSPVLGGGVAAYLEGGEIRDGGRVGILSGVFAAIPIALILIVIAGFGLLVVGEPVFLLFGTVGIVIIGFYVIALSAVGGVLGVYVKHEVLQGENTPG